MQTTRSGFVVQTTVRWTDPEAREEQPVKYQPSRGELRSFLAVILVGSVASLLMLWGFMSACEWVGEKLAGLIP